MNDFIVLTVVLSWALYGFYIVFRSERLVKEIRVWKNLDTNRGIWWGFFSLFILMDYKKKYFAEDDLSFLPEYKRIIFHHWVLLIWFILLVIFEQSTTYWTYIKPVELTAWRSRIFVKGRANSTLIRAAAHLCEIEIWNENWFR